MELCYATSKNPTEGFVYGGVIIANNDLGIDTYKPAKKTVCYEGNNHGGMEYINGEWYIFYHRHTNGRSYSRQAMAQKINILPDGSIPQVEVTSCGLNGGPLRGKGYYPAYIACNIISLKETGGYTLGGLWINNSYPIITQNPVDGEKSDGIILNLTSGHLAGFKYFDFAGVKRVTVRVRGLNGKLRGRVKLRLQWDGEVVSEIPIGYCAAWTDYSADVTIPDGVHALYFEYDGPSRIALGGFTLE